MPYRTIQMNSEDIMLGEINQSPKDKYCMVPSLQGILKSQTRRNTKWNGGCQDMEGGAYGELLFRKH